MNEKKRGIFYGVGTGPGDPELMTLKAVRIIKENDIFAVTAENPEKSKAYKIAVAAVPELKTKKIISMKSMMTYDTKKMKKYHTAASHKIAKYLNNGENVVFLTLGDPSVYSTCSYIQQILKIDGYKTLMISGITSFCALAASVGISLTECDQKLHIYPASHDFKDVHMNDKDTYVFMKFGRKMKKIKNMLMKQAENVVMAANCGMKNEKLYYNTDTIPNDTSYFSIIIADKRKNSAYK